MESFPQSMLGEQIRKTLDEAVAKHGWVRVQFITDDPNSLEIKTNGYIVDFAILPVERKAES